MRLTAGLVAALSVLGVCAQVSDISSGDITSVSTSTSASDTSTIDTFTSDTSTSISTSTSDTSTSDTSTSTSISTITSTFTSTSASISISDFVNSTSLTDSLTFTINATGTSTSSAPNATETTDQSALYPGGEDKWDPDQNTDTPAELIADEQVLTLAYAANYDQNLCLAKAQAFADSSSSAVRRQWGEKVHARRRRRSLIGNRCLGVAYNIQTTIHWVIPDAILADPVKLKAWKDDSLLNTYLAITNQQLAKLNGALTVVGKWLWKLPGDPHADQVSRNLAPYARHSTGQYNWVANARRKTGATDPSHLNVFIVEDGGVDIAGYSNFPGKDNTAGEVDGVFLVRKWMDIPSSMNSRNQVALAHEIGHWLGLFHLHEGGCSGSGPNSGDRCTDTLQYPATADYAQTCDKVSKGAGGSGEHNVMSYANGATPNTAVFSPEQVQRAVVGFTMYRRGLRRDTLTSGVVKFYCDQKSLRRRENAQPPPLRRDDLGPVPLSKRQMATELSRFCQRTDLVVEDHEFNELAETGLYNTDSPKLSDQPAVVTIDTSSETGNNEDAGGALGGFGITYDQVVQHIDVQYSENGKIVSNATITATGITITSTPSASATSSGTSGSGSSSGIPSVGPAVSIVVALVIAVVSAAIAL